MLHPTGSQSQTQLSNLVTEQQQRNLVYKTPPSIPSKVLSTLTGLMNLVTSSHLRIVSQAEQRRGRKNNFLGIHTHSGQMS